ncbi:MAG TPA: hypothetical protein VGO79_08035 [Thermoanaerobaculia bacterium]|jgi:hypothetical protein
MRSKAAALALFLAVGLAFPIASPLLAADHVVLRVLVVKSDNPEAYLKEIDRARELLKKLGTTQIIRVWRARFAGEHAGSIVVSVEYPSMASMAKDEAAIDTNPEYIAWYKGLDKVRTVVSDSLYTEMK